MAPTGLLVVLATLALAAVATGARAVEHSGPLVEVLALRASGTLIRRCRFLGRSRRPSLLDPFGCAACTWASVSGPPLERANAGIAVFWAAVTARPSEMTDRNSASGTMARKTGSLSDGAGPELAVGPVAAGAAAHCTRCRNS